VTGGGSKRQKKGAVGRDSMSTKGEDREVIGSKKSSRERRESRKRQKGKTLK